MPILLMKPRIEEHAEYAIHHRKKFEQADRTAYDLLEKLSCLNPTVPPFWMTRIFDYPPLEKYIDFKTIHAFSKASPYAKLATLQSLGTEFMSDFVSIVMLYEVKHEIMSTYQEEDAPEQSILDTCERIKELMKETLDAFSKLEAGLNEAKFVESLANTNKNFE